MKKFLIIVFTVVVLATCKNQQKDFSNIKTGMTKSDVVLFAGEPQKKNDIVVAELWVYPDANRTVVFRHDTVYDVITSAKARIDSVKMSMNNIADDVDKGLEDVNKSLKKTGAEFDSVAKRVKIGLDTIRKK